jgi:hypothetical protein
VDRVPLNLEEPAALQLHPVRWRIVTPDNIQQVWKEITESGNEAVLFAITDVGYEQLSVDFATIRNHMAQQRTVILKMKEYYEPKTP